MKQYLLSLALVITMSATMFSCKSELDLDKTLKFSKLSVEEQKQKLEDSGIEFIDIAEGLMDTKAFTTVADFSASGSVSYIPEMEELKSAMVNVNSKSILKLQKQIIQREEDDMWGTYEWNRTYQTFEKIANSNGRIKEAIYFFPADDQDTGNNATFTLYYTESDVKVPESDVYSPENISVSLDIYGETVIDGEYSCEYNNDTPSKMDSHLTIEDYSWSLSFTNNEQEISEEFSIKFQKDVMMKVTSKATGSFTYDELEYAEDPSDFVDEVAVSYQVMNVSILGGVKDMQALADEMNNLYHEETRAYYEAECDIINRNVILYAYFNDDNRKFADVEFFVDESTEVYNDYQWNENTWEWDIIEIEETNYEVAPRLVLSDGSKVDLEDYFSNGFEELSEKLENTLEDNFDEYLDDYDY